jgi:hypothetical protein
MAQIELDNLIDFWEGILLSDKFLMSPATTVLIEQTIAGLKTLKELKILKDIMEKI